MGLGRVPNRSDDLARPRERKGGSVTPVTKGVALPSTIPEPDEDWHPIARMMWDSLADSGQSSFYQQSDWALAYSLCDDLSRYKSVGRWNKHTGEYEAYRSPEMLKALLSGFTTLLVTEGDRRRLRIELDTPDDAKGDPAEVAVMADYKSALGII